MLSSRTTLGTLLVIAGSLFGQVQDSGKPAQASPYAALRQELGLTDVQMARLQAKDTPGYWLRVDALNEVQQTKLAAIAKVLERRDPSFVAFQLGLITKEQAIVDTQCWYRLPELETILENTYAKEIGLTAFQLVDQLQPWKVELAAKVRKFGELMFSGAKPDSPEVVQLRAEIGRLSIRLSER